MSDIRIAAFDREPIRGWMVEGLPCCVYCSPFGTLNGYVRLPISHPDLMLARAAEAMPGTPFKFPDGRNGILEHRGYDHVGVDVPGGWTYGPDEQNWIGFDTNHGHDHWTVEQRRANARGDERILAMIQIMHDVDVKIGPIPFDRNWMISWSQSLVERYVEEAARALAERARTRIRELLRGPDA